MPFIKLNQPKYLSEGQYLITDTDPDSTYFDVSEVPDILTGGKNLFMLKGNQSLLAPGSIIEIEVTDLNGRAIYHENAIYLEPGTKRRAVAIYVYAHTSQGGGLITITGTAQRRPNGKSVSLDLQRTPNVKWQKRVDVFPQYQNKTRVIMKRPPNITLAEVSKTYLTPSGGLQLVNVTHTALGVTFNPSGNGILFTTSSFFQDDDVGRQVVFHGGTPDLTNTGDDGEGVVVSTPIIEAGIISYVYNDNYVNLEDSSEIWPVQVLWPTGNYSTLYVPINGMTASIVRGQEFQWDGYVDNIESWAKVYISELDPLCGDIRSVKMYKRSQGFQQWEFVDEIVLESPELLQNNAALNGGLAQSLGKFNSQATVNNYWTASYSTNLDTQPPVAPITASDGSVLINAVMISGSEYLKDNNTNVFLSDGVTREDQYIEFRMKPSADFNDDGSNTSGIDIPSTGVYRVSLKTAAEYANDGGSTPTLKVYVSGSAVDTPIDGSSMLKLDTITTSQQGGVEVEAEGGILDVLQESNFDTGIQIVNTGLLNYEVEVSRTGSMALVFHIVSGKWHIADVSIRPIMETGFTPNYVIPEFYVGSQADMLDFRFELYDNIDNKVYTKNIYDVPWSGGNVYISGDNNVIEGVVIVGSNSQGPTGG